MKISIRDEEGGISRAMPRRVVIVPNNTSCPGRLPQAFHRVGAKSENDAPQAALSRSVRFHNALGPLEAALARMALPLEPEVSQ